VFVIIKGNVIHACLGYNIIAIQEQLMGIASLIKEILGKSISIINSTYCVNRAILCSGNIDVKEVLSSLDRHKDPILYRPSVKIHVPLEIQVISDIPVCFLVASGANDHTILLLGMLEINRRHIQIEFTEIWPLEINRNPVSISNSREETHYTLCR
jgi:hypothetical protein